MNPSGDWRHEEKKRLIVIHVHRQRGEKQERVRGSKKGESEREDKTEYDEDKKSLRSPSQKGRGREGGEHGVVVGGVAE